MEENREWHVFSRNSSGATKAPWQIDLKLGNCVVVPYMNFACKNKNETPGKRLKMPGPLRHAGDLPK